MLAHLKFKRAADLHVSKQLLSHQLRRRVLCVNERGVTINPGWEVQRKWRPTISHHSSSSDSVCVSIMRSYDPVLHVGNLSDIWGSVAG